LFAAETLRLSYKESNKKRGRTARNQGLLPLHGVVLDIDLFPISYLFRRGHAVRVAIARALRRQPGDELPPLNA
jgi:predicted acyl esterase